MGISTKEYLSSPFSFLHRKLGPPGTILTILNCQNRKTEDKTTQYQEQRNTEHKLYGTCFLRTTNNLYYDHKLYEV